MTNSNSISEFAKSQPVYIGIDVHKRSWSLCVIHCDQVVGQYTIAANNSALGGVLGKFSDFKIYSAYEAGFSGFGLHFYLRDAGVENIVVAAHKIPVQSGDLVKTDRRDSQKIAFCLSKGLLKGIYVPTPEELDRRELLRTREKIKKKRVRVICHLKMLLLQHGFQLNGQTLSAARIAEIRAMALPQQVRFCAEIFLEELAFMNRKLLDLDAAIRRAVNESSYRFRKELIETVPGIGPIISTSLCFEIGDWSRFKNAGQLCAYLGLTPREYSSGERVYRGRITGQGKTWLRAYLVEASWKTIGVDPELKKFYHRIRSNTGSGKKAIVAVARKLVCRIFSMVKNNKAYAIQEAA